MSLFERLPTLEEPHDSVPLNRLRTFRAVLGRFDPFKTVSLLCVRSPGLTFRERHAAYCPHSEFICLVWVSEQTAVFSLYSINRLVLRRVRKIAENDYVC